MNELIIYCDGGSRGNPGPAASAFVATSDNQEIFKQSLFLGNETNNYAEYKAVLLAVEWLISSQSKNKYVNIIINLDSQLVQRQLTGIYKIKNENLKKIAIKIINLLKESSLEVKFIWNYREKNSLADELVNFELDKSSTGK